MDKRKKVTASTLRADKRMRDLLELLADRQPQNVLELSAQMGISRSGVRKYCYQLIDDGIIAQHYEANREAFVTLVAPPHVLAQYALTFNNPEPPAMPPHQREVMLMPGTLVHKINDDGEVPTKPARNVTVIVRRHPDDVWFFGDGPARSVQVAA